jgi:phage gp46-like protein
MLDIALVYDPVSRVADLAFNGRDFVLDRTPATPLIMSVGCSRRAHDDDVLPDDNADFLAPASVMSRRGWPGDSLNPLGRLTGSRMWLLVRQKHTEAVRRAAESYLAEACDWLNTDLGLPVQITVRWLASSLLGYRVRVGKVEMALQMPVAE